MHTWTQWILYIHTYIKLIGIFCTIPTLVFCLVYTCMYMNPHFPCVQIEQQNTPTKYHYDMLNKFKWKAFNSNNFGLNCIYVCVCDVRWLREGTAREWQYTVLPGIATKRKRGNWYVCKADNIITNITQQWMNILWFCYRERERKRETATAWESSMHCIRTQSGKWMGSLPLIISKNYMLECRVAGRLWLLIICTGHSLLSPPICYQLSGAQ